MKKKRTNPYKEANEAFLAVKAQEEGIVALDNGVLYKVLEEGRGEGDQLPALFMVGDLIMGWQIALTRMHEGDKWEVYIPAKWGYGSMKMDDIPAHSTLIFELQLVKIER